jgi:hypothetical protein
VEHQQDQTQKTEWKRLLISKNEKRKPKPIDPVDQLVATPVLPEDNIGQSLERAPTGTSSIADVDIVAHRNATNSTTATKSTVSKPANAMSGAMNGSTSAEKSPDAPKSPTKKRFSTLLGKLKRKPKGSENEASTEKGFAGGAAYTGAFATGTSSTEHPAVERSPSISSLSSDEEAPIFEGGSEQARGRSKTRIEHDVSGGEGEEEFEEARDTFDDSALAPPKKLLSTKPGSPARETRFSEAL